MSGPASDPSERGDRFAMDVLLPIFLGLTNLALLIVCIRRQRSQRAQLEGKAVPLVPDE